jgi:hypothetical protein
MRSDINRINPNNLPIFRILPENMHLHERIMRGLEGLTTELGRHQDDEFNEGMGAHGDYGGLKAEKYHMMRISLGIGGSREIRFFAKEIDSNSKDDAAGTIVEDLGFQLVMSGCRNAYTMTHFGNGMTGMCLSDQHGTSDPCWSQSENDQARREPMCHRRYILSPTKHRGCRNLSEAIQGNDNQLGQLRGSGRDLYGERTEGHRRDELARD